MSWQKARYDAEVHMFALEPQEPNLESLRFLRWLAEQGRLEHPVSGPAGGRYVTSSVAKSCQTHLVDASFGS